MPTLFRLGIDYCCLVLKLLRLPDLLHLNPGLDIKTRKSLRRDAVNLLLSKLFRRKVLVFWRGWDNDACGMADFPGGNAGWLARAYRMADAHIVLASNFRDDLRRWGFLAPVYLETTVVGDELIQGPSLELAGRATGGFRVLFLSRIETAKGVFELLEAFQVLQHRKPGYYHLTIAGDGPDLDLLKQRAEDRGLSNTFFAGYVDGKQKSQCYNEADAFCFLSYTEGMPNAVLEAMAMGLPLVSSSAGGLRDILEDGVSGYLVRYDRSAEAGHRFSAEEVANRIEALATDPYTCRRMADRNRKYAMDKFAAPKVAGRLCSIYQDIIRNKPFRSYSAPPWPRLSR